MAELRGWAGKILTVDLSTRKVSTLETKTYSDRFLGGLGIGQKFYWDQALPELNAFHPDSPLILMSGPLAATLAPSAPRLVACGKSPAVGPEMFKSASLGGFFAAELKQAGYDGIVIQGRSSQPVYLNINNEHVAIKDADQLWGLTNSKTQDMLREALGSKVKFLTIGPGAEHGARIGTIATDVGGSGSKGFGSVMGSKNLKAIAVQGSGTIPAANPAEIKQIRKQIKAMTAAGYFNLYGTPFKAPKAEIVKKVHCHGCPQGCWRSLYKSVSGEQGIRKCQTPLFYSLWDQKLHQDPTETSFRATSLVNDYSLCVLEISFLILWLQKCLAQGVLSEKDTELPLSKMGSWEFIETLVKKISYGEGFGKILAEGVARAAEHVGKAAKAIADAGQAMPYGPKVFIPAALLYATEPPRPPVTELHELCSPLTKWAIWHTSKGTGSYVSTDTLRKIAKKFWGSEKAVDFSTYEGKALAAVKIQNRQYAKESLILCDFAYPLFDDAGSEDHVGDPSIESRLLSAVTGKEIDAEALDLFGARNFTLNRAILLREGRQGKPDDRLPETQFIEREEMIADVFGMHNPELLLPGSGDEIISRKGKALEKDKFEQIRDEYYRLRGWDVATGLLKRETLQEMDLPEVIEPLKQKVI